MKKINISKQGKSNLITYGIILLLSFLLFFIGQSSYQLKGLLVPVCTQIMLAVSLNLTVGILGELSLGHAGFMCIGTFVGASFSIYMEQFIPIAGVRFFLALFIGALSAGIMGFLIGLPVLRLKGDYLAIVTLAFGEIIKNIVNMIYLGYDSKGLHFSMTDTASMGLAEDGVVIIKGPQGVMGTPADSNFGIGVILVLITVFIVLNLIHSRDGRAIMAIRDNEIAAESVGINITKYKLMAFTISAALAGMAGSFYAHNYNNIKASTNNFGYNMSIMILVFVVLGGIGSIRGSVIAATILYMLPEMLRFMSQYRMLVYAIVLIIMMLFTWSPKAQEWKSVQMEKLKVRLKPVIDKFRKKSSDKLTKEGE
ncbi:MAG: branched-chain amino acid ABC transporter permease [Lachnospiraceae bacterium]|nr:branched-chain amino acid ABC transporter permease [Lachnospiraceae bacterium]